MVDTIRFNEINPTISPARKVTRLDSKRRNNRQTPFKDGLDREQKKGNKDDSDSPKVSDSETSINTGRYRKHYTGKGDGQPGESKKSAGSRLIDIRV